MKAEHYKIMNKELFNLLIGRPGGKTTVKILDELLKKPQNANQLAVTLGFDYNTIIYHTKILCSHKFTTKEKFEKYTYYYPSEKFLKSLEEYNIIKETYF